MVPAALSAPHKVEAVVIGGSAGALAALREILPGLPADFPPVLVVVHIPPSVPALLAEIFAPRCAMQVREAEPFEAILPGSVYFAPPDYHLLVERERRCALSIEPPIHFSRPAIDALFESAADVYRAGLVGLVLTGASPDGARGLHAVHAAGGVAIVQEPGSAEIGTMPAAALAAVPSARVLALGSVLHHLRSLCPR